ncbi:unnamed protein product [Gongylonema pulchrum]|uniref:DZF domain-containing protein n=1 Tax=Gongylonema pulchrum TaxID=637853 RepID=A0A183EMI7_9BILA|nr:unnamed protein product [Gongylonema pulchrum]
MRVSVRESIMISHMAALRHARWFEENASNPTIKSHYAVVNTASQQPLTAAEAFRRFFQLLAAGLLLPTSPALIDPCEQARRIHQSLTYEQMVIHVFFGLEEIRIYTLASSCLKFASCNTKTAFRHHRNAFIHRAQFPVAFGSWCYLLCFLPCSARALQ